MTEPVRLAFIGHNHPNGHPYSWSAIINGYRAEELARSPYPNIADYLGEVDIRAERLRGARVTHVWTEDEESAQHIARTSHIPNVLRDPRDALGEVDAVVFTTDDPARRRTMVEPFLDAGLPVLIDKPLAGNRDDLAFFKDAVANGAQIMSCSALRFSSAVEPARAALDEVGQLQLVHGTTRRSWAAYGIHVLEFVTAVLGGNLDTDVDVCGRDGRRNYFLGHNSGADVQVSVYQDFGRYFRFSFFGSEGYASAGPQDWFQMFRSTLEAFLEYVRTGLPPFAFSQTESIVMAILSGNEKTAR